MSMLSILFIASLYIFSLFFYLLSIQLVWIIPLTPPLHLPVIENAPCDISATTTNELLCFL